VKKEWERLQADPYHRLEFDTTSKFLRSFLPRRGLILDAGGGPGRYTIELAKKGYDVILLDYTPANLRFAKERIKKEKLGTRVKEIVEGSVVDLSRFSDDAFDAVVCLGGPLSHILREGERQKAVSELVRVAKRGSPIFISVMGRLGFLAMELRYFPGEVRLPLFARVRDSGDYLGERGFTATHFFLPEELRDYVELRSDVEVLKMVGLEGIGSGQREEINSLARNKRRWSAWLATHYETCTHPSVVGSSEHMLLICRKKE